MRRPINPGHELDKIEWHVKRLASVFADHSLIMGDPPEDDMLDLWARRAEALAYRLNEIHQLRREIWLMRSVDEDRSEQGLPPLYADVPGVIP